MATRSSRRRFFGGGEFVCIINLSSSSFYEHKRLLASLNVSYDPAGEGSISYENVRTVLSRYTKINAQTFWLGVKRSPPIIVSGLDERGKGNVETSALLDYFVSFEKIVDQDKALRPIRLVIARGAQDWPIEREYLDIDEPAQFHQRLAEHFDYAQELLVKWEDVAANPYHYRDAYDNEGRPIVDVSELRRHAHSRMQQLENVLQQISVARAALELNPFAPVSISEQSVLTLLQSSRELPLRQRTFAPVLSTLCHCTKHNPTRGSGHAPNQAKVVRLIGDNVRADSMWFPHRAGTSLQVWSMRIDFSEPRPIGIRLEYAGQFADGTRTGWMPDGSELVHPTNRGVRLRRLAFRLEGDMLEAYNIEYQTHATQHGDTAEIPGTRNSGVPPGTMIGDAVHNIENIRVAIWPKSENDE